MSGTVLWAIFLLPLSSFLFISLVLRPFFKNQPKLSGYVIIGSLAAALGLSIWVLTSLGEGPITSAIDWASVGGLKINLEFSADELTACFDLDVHLRNVDRIFERVLGKEAGR